MSDDFKNFREAVAKFDVLQLELDILKDALETNFVNYKNVNAISSEITTKNQSVLHSINTLQIEATSTVENAINTARQLKEEMGKYYSAEYTQTKKDFEGLLGDINSSIHTLRSSVHSDIQSAMNDVHIDTSTLSKIIDDKIEGIDTDALEGFTTSVNSYIEAHTDNFTATIEKLNTASEDFKTISTNVSKSRDALNHDIKKINWLNYGMVAISSLGIGLIIGGGGMLFKAFDLVEYTYSEKQEKALAQLEAKKASIDELPKLYQYLRDNEIEVHFGKFSDTKKPYISIDDDDLTKEISRKKCFVRDNNQAVIRLEESKVIGLE